MQTVTSLLLLLVLGVFSRHAAAADVSTTFASGIRVIASEANFSLEAHRVVGCGANEACVIDQHLVFGAIHRPKTVVERVRLEYGSAVYELDVSGLL